MTCRPRCTLTTQMPTFHAPHPQHENMHTLTADAASLCTAAAGGPASQSVCRLPSADRVHRAYTKSTNFVSAYLGLAAARCRLELQEALAHGLADLHDRRHVTCAGGASHFLRVSAACCGRPLNCTKCGWPGAAGPRFEGLAHTQQWYQRCVLVWYRDEENHRSGSNSWAR